jgi:hypothetical protein
MINIDLYMSNNKIQNEYSDTSIVSHRKAYLKRIESELSNPDAVQRYRLFSLTEIGIGINRKFKKAK